MLYPDFINSRGDVIRLTHWHEVERTNSSNRALENSYVYKELIES